MTRDELTSLIVGRLESEADKLREDFNTSKGATKTRHAALDNLLPEKKCA